MHLLESEDALLRQVEHHILSVLQLDCHEDGILSLGPLDAWELSTTRNIIDKLEFLGCQSELTDQLSRPFLENLLCLIKLLTSGDSLSKFRYLTAVRLLGKVSNKNLTMTMRFDI